MHRLRRNVLETESRMYVSVTVRDKPYAHVRVYFPVMMITIRYGISLQPIPHLAVPGAHVRIEFIQSEFQNASARTPPLHPRCACNVPLVNVARMRSCTVSGIIANVSSGEKIAHH